jgi:hypothetical protein
MVVKGLRIQGHIVLTLQEERPSGLVVVRRQAVGNSILNTFRSSFAQWLASTAAVTPPNYIGVGRGSATEYHSTNQDGYVTLDLTSQQQLAQGFQVSGSVKVHRVSLFMMRQGYPTGTAWVEIQTDSAGDPSGSPIASGVSQGVNILAIPSVPGWQNFEFTTPPSLAASTPYHLVLKAASYSYQSGADQINWGCDRTSPTYAHGVMKAYDGSSWSGVSPVSAAIFSVVQANEASITALAQPVLYDGANQARVADYSLVQGLYNARKTVIFRTNEANDIIREIGLFDAANNGALWARAIVDVNKTSTQILTVYWTINIQAV